MSIEVSGGGSVAVTTEELLDDRRLLVELAGRAADARAMIARALALAYRVPGAPAGSLTRAGRDLDVAAEESERLARSLMAAATAYGWAERVALAQQLLVAKLAGPGRGIGELLTAVGAASAGHGSFDFSDPRIVAALRDLADAVPVPALVAVVRALPGRALDETPVEAQWALRGSVPRVEAAPGGFGDLARRIPKTDEGAAQIRVERYDLPDGRRHWIVYAGGTIDWGLTPGSEPWDDTSNLVGIAGGSAGSTRATIAALAAAGWRSGEPVVPVGHSQGGIVASAVAASGLAPAPMLVTFGSPTAGVPPTIGTTAVAVEHTDDPVPPLGGSARNPLTDRRLLVREPGPGADGSAMPAHGMSGYAATAARMDASADDRLTTARAQLREYTGGESAQVTLWRGVRDNDAERAPLNRRDESGSGGGR